LTPICTKSFVGWGFAPNPTGGAYSAPSDPVAVFRRPTFIGRNGRGQEERSGEEKKSGGERGERKEGSSSFTLGRKRKVGAYVSLLVLQQIV